jgi:alkylhydroperoxidase family enzyme
VSAELQRSLIEALEGGYCGVEAGFGERERALLRYADRLTLDPASVNPGHVAELREAGLDDLEIHDACAIVSYFAFVNRVADGLGVELEREMEGS